MGQAQPPGTGGWLPIRQSKYRKRVLVGKVEFDIVIPCAHAAWVSKRDGELWARLPHGQLNVNLNGVLSDMLIQHGGLAPGSRIRTAAGRP